MGGLYRWLISLALIGLIVAASFLLIAWFFPGDTFLERLTAAYRALVTETTRRQFTVIMRAHPWWLILPGVGIVVVAGWLLPQRQWGRAILIYMTFAIGFVAGHVFW
jgi:hypothetical protein